MSIDGQETAGMDLDAVKQRLGAGRKPQALIVERNGKRVDLLIQKDDEQTLE